MPRLLIAEDEERMRRLLGMLLGNADFELDLAADGKEALQFFENTPPDVVITDLRMPNMTGMDLIRAVRERDADVPILVITAFGSIESAVDAMRAGATDYITKPFEEARIRLAIAQALERRDLLSENRVLRAELRNRYAFDTIIAESHKMLQVLEQARQVAAAATTVMLYGESGTGKELVTRAIHEASPRSRGPFVALNCAAIPENLLESELFGHERGSFTGATDAKKGRFELASSGTLFLDEIGEMAQPLQAKVLRAIETQEFERVGGTRTIRADIRFIAATNKNLRQRVADGKFRDDLFYRINVFPIVVPPLRDRPDDIIPLTEHFLARFAREMGKKPPRIPPASEQLLLTHRWMGNVRELQNVIERAMILLQEDVLEPDLLHIDALDGIEAMGRATAEYEKSGPSLGPARIAVRPPAAPAAKGRKKKGTESSLPAIAAPVPRWHPFRIPEIGFDLESHERSLIEQALERAKSNKTAAAKLLGLSRATLRYRLEKYGISGADGD
ncbi:sigma-54-dependent Fis family transcriptional regulator [Candidatus Poribacteria bacterium]|nr:sigma-54-dependent Fis family transcriptional regulator [Candidatus Poribacteria bacterium]